MIEAQCDHSDAAIGCRNGKRLQGFSDEEIVGISVGFLVAGDETSASTMSCAAYLLALHPDVQQKLQSEIDQLFDHNPVSSLCIIIVYRIMTIIKITFFINFYRRLLSTQQ